MKNIFSLSSKHQGLYHVWYKSVSFFEHRNELINAYTVQQMYRLVNVWLQNKQYQTS